MRIAEKGFYFQGLRDMGVGNGWWDKTGECAGSLILKLFGAGVNYLGLVV